MTKTTIDDVAALAGVSIKTVSRVANKEPNVREATRARVLKAIGELNYRPNPSARSLAGRRSFLVGLLYDDPDAYENPSSNYILNIQQGVLRTCKAANYDFLIHPCDYRDKNLSEEIRSLINHSKLDGLILVPPLSDMKSVISAIKRTGTPAVRISPGTEREFQSAVYTNDRRICAEMTKHLASLGHTRIAFITGHPDHKALVKRYLGYQDGLENSGLKGTNSLVKAGDNSFGAGEECARKLLKIKKPPTAIFACNDDMAAGVIRVAYQIGVKLPNELSVVGFDDIPLAKMIYPTLTTIRQPIRAMAERAAQMLIDQMHSKPAVKERQIIYASLKIRESTGAAKGAPQRTSKSRAAA